MKTHDSSSGRLLSLDALRGADMLFIMGFSQALVALCAVLGMKGCWLARQMVHVPWHGFAHHDTIFPLFLFLAGVSWPFSYAKQLERGASRRTVLLRILRRAVVLSALGLVGWKLFAFRFAELRWDSVLCHIGVCWGVAAAVYVFVGNRLARLAIAAGLLVAHWALLCCLTAPDAAALAASTDPQVAKTVASYAAFGTDGFSFTGNIAGWIDRAVMPGVLHERVFDPDGLLGKLTGIALAMFGVMAGELLRRGDLPGNRRALVLFAAAAVALGLVFAWRPWCPVNKKLWTSTFVLASAAYSCFCLGLFHWIVDVKGWSRWTFPLRVIGMNSITIYIAMRFLGFGAMSKFFFAGVASFGGRDWSDLVFFLGQTFLGWLFLWFLYRKSTFLRV